MLESTLNRSLRWGSPVAVVNLGRRATWCCCPRNGRAGLYSKISLRLSFTSSRRLPVQCLGSDGGSNDVSIRVGLGRTTRFNVKEWDWSTATVIENRADSADGTLRTLVLSIEDHVTFLDGRKVKRRQEAPRWMDYYKVPGQFVGILQSGETMPNDTVIPSKLFAIASSPYDSRKNSAFLDASLIEVLVDKCADDDESALAELAPGALLHVSQVLGTGYSSLFDKEVTLSSVLEDSCPLLLLAVGARGIAPLRAAIEWTPVQAQATAQQVCLVYVAKEPVAAAYLKDWDTWREAGVDVQVWYQGGEGGPANNASNGSGMQGLTSVKDILEHALFAPGGLLSAGDCNPDSCCVMMSGLPGDVAAQLTKRLTAEGVNGERILFCDFF